MIIALFTTFVLKVFHVLDVFTDKFLTKWDNTKGVDAVIMCVTIIILTALLSSLFLCYYRITSNQNKSIVVLKETKSLIEHTNGAKEFAIRKTENELGLKYRELANKPNDKILSSEIREIEKKLDNLCRRNDNLF